MIEKDFVNKNINKVKIEEFLAEELDRANYSHIDFAKTSTSTKITIYSEKPGLVIGRGGHRIKEVTRKLTEDFGIENPQIEAQEVEEPDIDARVVAKNIKGWLEKGGHPKRVGNTYTRRVMDAGAVGVQIEISGKLSGSRGRVEKFSQGYVKKCGDTALKNVDYAYEPAVTQPGALGVKVRIMRELPGYMTRQQIIQEEIEESEEEKEAARRTKDPVKDDVTVDAAEEADESVDDDAEAELDASEAEDDEADEEASQDEEDQMDVDQDDEEVDYENLTNKTIKEIKSVADDMGLDYRELLEAERENKDRKTLKQWIEGKLED